MAEEEDFQIEPERRDPVAREITGRNARWAEMFGGSSTNLAQRARYQEAISAERGIRAEEREAAFDRSLLNKDARDLFFKEKAADLARARTIHDMDLKQRKFQMDQERFPLQMENERLKLQVQESTMDRALRKEARDANIALRTESQTEAFEEEIQGMIDQDANPHSRAFAEGLAKAYAKNPYADKNIVNQWFKNSRIEVTPEDFLAGLGEIDSDSRSAGKNITATLGQNGFTFTARPKPEVADQTKVRMDRLQKMLASPEGQNPQFKKYIEDEINDLKGGKSTQTNQTEAPKLEFQNDPEGFKTSYESAKPGTVLTYNGRKYTKPEPK